MGIGYPTETNDGVVAKNENIKKTRADSFSLYQGWVSNRILLSLLNMTLLKSKVQKDYCVKKNNTENDKRKVLKSSNL